MKVLHMVAFGLLVVSGVNVGLSALGVDLIGSIVNQAYQSIQLSDLENSINEKLKDNILGLNLTDLKQKGISLLISTISSKISEIPMFLLGLLITLLATFYILIK